MGLPRFALGGVVPYVREPACLVAVAVAVALGGFKGKNKRVMPCDV